MAWYPSTGGLPSLSAPLGGYAGGMMSGGGGSGGAAGGGFANRSSLLPEGPPLAHVQQRAMQTPSQVKAEGARADEAREATVRLRRLLQEHRDNKFCADCLAPNPGYASITYGVFLCNLCYGVHRGMGTHISRTKSVQLDKWRDLDVRAMEAVGNERGAELWEAGLNPGDRPSPESTGGQREAFIRKKYEQQLWATPKARAMFAAGGAGADEAASPSPTAHAPPSATGRGGPTFAELHAAASPKASASNAGGSSRQQPQQQPQHAQPQQQQPPAADLLLLDLGTGSDADLAATLDPLSLDPLASTTSRPQQPQQQPQQQQQQQFQQFQQQLQQPLFFQQPQQPQQPYFPQQQPQQQQSSSLFGGMSFNTGQPASAATAGGYPAGTLVYEPLRSPATSFSSSSSTAPPQPQQGGANSLDLLFGSAPAAAAGAPALQPITGVLQPTPANQQQQQPTTPTAAQGPGSFGAAGASGLLSQGNLSVNALMQMYKP